MADPLAGLNVGSLCTAFRCPARLRGFCQRIYSFAGPNLAICRVHGHVGSFPGTDRSPGSQFRGATWQWTGGFSANRSG